MAFLVDDGPAPVGLIVVDSIYSLAMAAQWIILIITFTRVKDFSMFFRLTSSSRSRSSGGSSNSSSDSSKKRDNNQSSVHRSLSKRNSSCEENSMGDPVFRHRMWLTLGMVACLTPRSVDTLAIYFDSWIWVALVCFFSFSTFGISWILFLSFQHIKSFYVSEFGASPPNYISHTNAVLSGFTGVSFLLLSILLVLAERTIFIGLFYLFSAAIIGLFGVLQSGATVSIYRRLKETEDSFGCETKSGRQRAARIQRFRKIGYGIAIMSISVAVTCIASAVVFMVDLDGRVPDMELWKAILLAVQSNVMPQGSLFFIQYTQWIPAEKQQDEHSIDLHRPSNATIDTVQTNTAMPSHEEA